VPEQPNDLDLLGEGNIQPLTAHGEPGRDPVANLRVLSQEIVNPHAAQAPVRDGIQELLDLDLDGALGANMAAQIGGLVLDDYHRCNPSSTVCEIPEERGANAPSQQG